MGAWYGLDVSAGAMHIPCTNSSATSCATRSEASHADTRCVTRRILFWYAL